MGRIVTLVAELPLLGDTLMRLLTKSEIEIEYAFGIKQYEIDYGWSCQNCLYIWDSVKDYLSHDCFKIDLNKQQVLF